MKRTVPVNINWSTPMIDVDEYELSLAFQHEKSFIIGLMRSRDSSFISLTTKMIMDENIHRALVELKCDYGLICPITHVQGIL